MAALLLPTHLKMYIVHNNAHRAIYIVAKVHGNICTAPYMPQTHRDKHIYVVCVLCNTNLVSDLQWWLPVHCDVCNELWRGGITAREAAHQC